MLVLSRAEGEQIQIGPDVTITVIESRQGRARIGIDAPREIEIVRPDAKNKEPKRRGANWP